MTEAITYSLRTAEPRSDHYYTDVAALTGEVAAAARERLALPLATAPSPAPSFEEQVVELLTLGVLWRTYGGRALALPALGRRWLTRLGALRQQGGWRKRGADLLRGILSTLLLTRSAGLQRFHPSPADLERLLGWLEATGEYGQEAARLRRWQERWAGLSPADFGQLMVAVLAFAAWFEQRSAEALGDYTRGVDRYLAGAHSRRRWQEDLISTGRPRVEYHLNMVGAELMNRAYRQGFLEAARKAVLVPACMRALPEVECRAVREAHHLRCTGCTAGCRVHQVRRLAERHGAEVRIITHSSSAFGREELAGLGIVGIGCVSTLLSGGWRARALGLPAQCVLLDYAGCRTHWHPTGVATDLNMHQLRRVLEA